MRLRLIPIALLASLIFSGAGCTMLAPQVNILPITLEYWRADDPPESMTEIIDAYQKIHPNVTINYHEFRGDEISQKLLDAFAEDKGPDIFSVPNVRLREFQNLLLPLPKETTIPVRTVNSQKQIVNVKQKNTTITQREIIRTFVETVPTEIILPTEMEQGKPPQDLIYGLPLSVDTLGLLYNKTLLKKAGLEKPPVSWNELQYQVSKLTTFTDKGTIAQAGAPLGTVKNVRHSVELLVSMFSQYGARMSDSYGYPMFQQYPQGADTSLEMPSTLALEFYEAFATPDSGTYCWNESMPDSLDAFVTGQTAFYFGFPADIQTIRNRAPKLDFGVAPLPQYNGERQYNSAVFPVEVVAKKTKSPNEAWDFVQFVAQAEHVKSFLAVTNRPTALRALINEQSTNPDAGPFVNQLLTAKTWYKGKNYSKLTDIFTEMVAARPDPLKGIFYLNILNSAAEGVSETINPI